jgi:hypothetical protein
MSSGIRPSRTLTPEQIKEKMCGLKTQYATRKKARAEKKKYEKDYHSKMNYYRCPFCNYFHIGNRSEPK